MKLAIICGSHRPNAESKKVSEYIQQQSRSQYEAVDILNVAELQLPFWDEGVWQADHAEWQARLAPVQKVLQAADAVVVVSPEWAGMVPAGLKNLFLLCSNAELGHKPALIVAVSAGLGGSYPVAELRSSSYKNVHLCYIPDHVIIRHVGDVLNSAPDDAGELSSEDRYIRGRLSYSLNVLEAYGQALRQVREAGVVDHKTYPFGM